MSVVSSTPQSDFMQSRHERHPKLCSNKLLETCHNLQITPCGKQQEIVCYVKNINNKPIYPLMRVERQSVTSGRESRSYSFAFYLERWQPSSCLIQEVHLWYISLSFSLFHQHAPCTLHAAFCPHSTYLI